MAFLSRLTWLYIDGWYVPASLLESQPPRHRTSVRGVLMLFPSLRHRLW
jgi:hypothetical protein